MSKKLNVLGLFTGAGGLELGFKESGFNLLASSDIWKESESTVELNFPEVPFILEDINKLKTEDIRKIIGDIQPDVIVGGPPCQGFSISGDKNSSDPRNKLFESYVRIVNDIKPKCFVFENVKGIKTMFKGRYLNIVTNSFSEIGYNIHLKVMNASDYGVPQNRERVIIFGTRLDKKFNFPKPSKKSIGSLKPKENVSEAINDLVKIKDKEFPNHLILNHSDIVIERYKLIPEGEKLPPPEMLPKEIRRKNFGNTYVRLHRKKFAPTMVPGNNAFPVHPTLNRSLTPREAARIQSFPDDFIFTGNRKNQCILVGNAVPPLLAASIANEVKNYLTKSDYIGLNENLYQNKNERMEIKKAGENLTFIDLFSGAGGIGIGFENAGYKHLLSSDFDPGVEKTFRNFNPDTPFIKGDLSEDSTFNEIIKTIGDAKVDIIAGGPPCQGFSMFGNRRFIKSKNHNPLEDNRNDLVFTFLKYVEKIKPNWFLMENVAGFINLNKGFYLEEYIKKVESMGYKNYEFKIINTADYGVPQTRKRFIFIANRTGNIIPWPKPKFYKSPRDWEKPYRTVSQVVTDLDSKKSESKIFNHIPMNHSDTVKERFSYIKEGHKINPKDLPEHLKYSKTGKPIKSFSKVFYRLDRDKPSPTLVPGHSAFPIHPWLNRQITIREAARIQTFPDDIEFKGTVGQQCKQVGNAFPPVAAEMLANSLIKAINNDWKKNNLSGLVKYSLVE